MFEIEKVSGIENLSKERFFDIHAIQKPKFRGIYLFDAE